MESVPPAPTSRATYSKYILLLISVAIPTLVLIGWTLSVQVLKSVLPQFTPMNPITATCLLATALALMYEQVRPFNATLGIRMVGVLTLAVGGLMLLWYITGIDLKIDRIFFTNELGINRMALSTSIAFVLLSICLLIKPYLVGLLRLCYACFFALALYSFAAYLYGFVGIYGQTLFNPMAIHTALLFMLIATYLFIQEYTERRFTFKLGYASAVAFSIVILGILVSAYLFTRYQQTTSQIVLDEALILQKNISANDVNSLHGTLQDTDTQEYQNIKTELQKVPRESPQYRFAYVLGRNPADEVFFYADSEDPSSPDYSAPGTFYSDASPKLQSTWTTPKSFTEGPIVDQWGTRITAFVPVKKEDGSVAGVIGVDIDAEGYTLTLLLYSLTPLVGSIVVAIIGAYVLRAHRKTVV